MGTALHQEVFHGPSLRGGEEKLAGVAVVEVDLRLALGILDKLRLLEIARVLSVEAIEIADPICSLSVSAPSKIALNRNVRSTVRFGRL
jgi:hypothetical protein